MDWKGWHFLEIGPRGETQRIGQVIDRVAEGIYLCQIHEGKFTRAEVVRAETMIGSWKLFPDRQEMVRFVNASRAPAPEAAEAEPADKPNGDKPLPKLHSVPREEEPQGDDSPPPDEEPPEPPWKGEKS